MRPGSSIVRGLLKVAPGSYCEKRKHEVFEKPVGSIRIAVVELLVAYIDKSRNAAAESAMPGLIEEIMIFFCNNTMNDFIGIEMVQLVRRVLASNIGPRILSGMLTHRVLEEMEAAIGHVSNIWELGHLRCIVSDVLAKHDDDTTVRGHLESFSRWEKLHQSMNDMRMPR